MIQHRQVNIWIHYISRMKGNNLMIISIDEEKAFDKIHDFMNKTFKKLGIKERIST